MIRRVVVQIADDVVQKGQLLFLDLRVLALDVAVGETLALRGPRGDVVKGHIPRLDLDVLAFGDLVGTLLRHFPGQTNHLFLLLLGLEAGEIALDVAVGELSGGVVAVGDAVGEPFDPLLNRLRQTGRRERRVWPVGPQGLDGHVLPRDVGYFLGRVGRWIDDRCDLLGDLCLGVLILVLVLLFFGGLVCCALVAASDTFVGAVRRCWCSSCALGLRAALGE